VLADAIASSIPESQFRNRLSRVGVPADAVELLSTALFSRAAAIVEERLERLPAVLGGRVLVSYDWKVQCTLASSSLDVQAAPSVLLCLRTRGEAADVRTDFLELSAAELDAAIAQLQAAVAAGAAIAGAAVR
jgi:uncharacterized small protein (DUF1192 family)